ncbi:MAG: insulinase family protein [Acinetobacter sp.]|nr:insulinase family protein [Acinetobacter sp.]
MLLRFRTLSLAICVLGVSATGLAQPILLKSEQNIEEYKLDNGLRVILAPNDKENKVFMNTIYLTGALNDPQGKGGMAHLLEHLAFKGTENVKGEEFQRRLDQYSLMSNASTDYYSTKYTSVIRPEKTAIDEMIYLEAERMDKLVLQEKFVPSEINIVEREREVRLDQPFSVLMDQIWKSAYGNQYLGRLPIGDLKELKSIKMDELNKFYRTWYAPNNAVMVIAGKFDKKQVLDTVEKNFNSIAARTVPKQVNVPVLDSSKIQERAFEVKKGSDFGKYNIYLNGKNQQIQTALALSPFLFTMQPSGHLYKDVVETGTATQVQSTTWLTQDFNLVFMGAVYAPNHDAQKVGSALMQGIEKKHSFNEVELNRVKNLIKNSQKSMMTSASAVGGMLSDYVVSSNGDWTQYFKDQAEVQNLKVNDVNQIINQFLIAEHRISGDIKPTPEDQKKALELQKGAETAKTLDQQDTKAEPLKDPSVYKAEVAQNLTMSQQYVEKIDQKIQTGTLKNGMQYALFPTSTRDDKTYASIALNFGTAESLKDQAEVIGFMSYLLLRASEQYSLQDIADKSIDAGGRASASAVDNGISIQISAKNEKFEEFFKFIIDVMNNPKFEQTQFDLIKSQTLSSLNRSYTEPETVASLTIARIVEKYQPGDLRYHFEPELAKQQVTSITNDNVKSLYKQYFTTQNGQISVTGDFNAKSLLKYLNKSLGQSKTTQPYQRLSSEYFEYPAQKVHALAEQRQFGNYQALITLPVGNRHPDAEALLVLSNILGESQLSSRLAMELREKNALVYSFGSNMTLSSFQNTGALGISADYTAGKSTQVSQGVHKVLNDLLKNGVTEQELEAAKANIMKQRVTNLEDERRIHRGLNSQLEQNRSFKSRLERDQAFAQLTKADIDAVIQKYIKVDHLVEVMADQYAKPVK